MSVKIRLSRRGTKKRPFNHIVVANSRDPRDGNFIEKVGTYDPMLPKESDKRITLVIERIKYWLSQGAQPTDRVARFLSDAGLIEKYKINDKQTKQPQPKKKALERLKIMEEKKKADEEAKRKADEEAKKAFEQPAPVVAEVAPVEEKVVVAEVAPVEEKVVAAEVAPSNETPVA